MTPDEPKIRSKPETTRAKDWRATREKLKIAHAAFEQGHRARQEVLKTLTARLGIDLTAATAQSRKAFEEVAERAEAATAKQAEEG